MPERRLSAAVALLALASLLAAAGAAAAQAAAADAPEEPHLILLGFNNLLANGNFDTGISGWTVYSPVAGQVGWDSTKDSAGKTGSSGAAFAIANGDSQQISNYLQTCVNLPVDWRSLDLEFDFSWMTATSGAQANGLGLIDFGSFPNPNCIGGLLQSLSYELPYTSGTWESRSFNSNNSPLLPINTQSVNLVLSSISPGPGAKTKVWFDSIAYGPTREAGFCREDSSILCVDNDRFQIKATFAQNCSTLYPGGTANGVQTNGQGGYLWCFDATNPELFVKVLDACSVTNSYWVFIAGLTNVGTTITVTDTTTGQHKTYSSRNNTNFVPIFDTAGLAVCP